MIPQSSHTIDLASLKTAIVHEWFVDYSGSERVVEQMLNLFPNADLYAQVDNLPDDLRWFIKNKKVNTSFIQKLPRGKTNYRMYLPLMPLAVEQFDLSEYDLVISSNHAVAKGVITGPDQVHICMCYSPMRYAWDLTHQYLRETGLSSGLKGWLAKYILHRIRIWDWRTSYGVDKYISISNYISRRIKKVYGRNSTVIYPPVDVDAFEIETRKDDYYITASRMVPYKKIDLIVDAFSHMPERKLVVIGDGPDFNKIKSRAGKNVELLGYQPSDVLKRYMQRARAFVFAAEEDFGITPVEAQACGTPVIAFGRGGSLETIVAEETGVFFDNQDVHDIIGAVRYFEKNIHRFNPHTIRSNALRFSKERFRGEFKGFVEKTIKAHGENRDLGQRRKLLVRGHEESVVESVEKILAG